MTREDRVYRPIFSEEIPESPNLTPNASKKSYRDGDPSRVLRFKRRNVHLICCPKHQYCFLPVSSFQSFRNRWMSLFTIPRGSSAASLRMMMRRGTLSCHEIHRVYPVLSSVQNFSVIVPPTNLYETRSAADPGRAAKSPQGTHPRPITKLHLL